jgi:hypothetical protein
VIDDDLDELLKFGIRRDDLDRLKGEINAVELGPDRRRALDEDLESARQRQDELRNSSISCAP